MELDYDSVVVTDVVPWKNGFAIRWDSDFGFGEYIIRVKAGRNEFGFADGEVTFEGESECMDCQEDKRFLETLFNSLKDQIRIIS